MKNTNLKLDLVKKKPDGLILKNKPSYSFYTIGRLGCPFFTFSFKYWRLLSISIELPINYKYS